MQDGEPVNAGEIAYDCSGDHGCVELREADPNGKADLSGLGKGQQAYDCECPGTCSFPGVLARACDECNDEDEHRLYECRQDQPASLPRSNAMRKLSEHETSNDEAAHLTLAVFPVRDCHSTYQLIDTAIVCSTLWARASLLNT